MTNHDLAMFLGGMIIGVVGSALWTEWVYKSKIEKYRKQIRELIGKR